MRLDHGRLLHNSGRQVRRFPSPKSSLPGDLCTTHMQARIPPSSTERIGVKGLIAAIAPCVVQGQRHWSRIGKHVWRFQENHAHPNLSSVEGEGAFSFPLELRKVSPGVGTGAAPLSLFSAFCTLSLEGEGGVRVNLCRTSLISSSRQSYAKLSMGRVTAGRLSLPDSEYLSRQIRSHRLDGIRAL